MAKKNESRERNGAERLFGKSEKYEHKITEQGLFGDKTTIGYGNSRSEARKDAARRKNNG
jgi:hypothetical protein